MLQRSIPSSGELLPVIGLGTWQRFDAGNDPLRRQKLAEVLKGMLHSGGKLIDSSPMYSTSEEVVGDLTSATGIADRFFYATKVWTSGREEGIAQMEASIKKMRRQTMDLMQVHNLVDWKTHLKTLQRWKAEGKIRYIGITHYTVSAHKMLEEIINAAEIDFVQFNYSIRVRNAETSLLNTALKNKVAVIINEPLEKGALFELVKGKTVPEWAIAQGMQNWPQFFLKYIIAHPAVNCVIPATGKVENLLMNMSASEGKLPDENTRRKMVEYIEQFK